MLYCPERIIVEEVAVFLLVSEAHLNFIFCDIYDGSLEYLLVEYGVIVMRLGVYYANIAFSEVYYSGFFSFKVDNHISARIVYVYDGEVVNCIEGFGSLDELGIPQRCYSCGGFIFYVSDLLMVELAGYKPYVAIEVCFLDLTAIRQHGFDFIYSAYIEFGQFMVFSYL